jgi:membrane protease YdiL (CAAX protease family)
MQSLPPDSIKYLVLLAIPVLGGIVYHLAVSLDLRRRGGLVQVRHFGIPDFFFGGVLAFFFLWGGVSSFFKTAGPGAAVGEAREERLLESAVLMGMIFVSTVAFARLRGIPMKAFGLAWENASKIALRAALGLGMIVPPVWALNLAMQYLIAHNNPQEQDIVTMFRQAAGDGDGWSVRLTVISAVLIAPLVEETVFRGYFYPVIKPHLGAFGAAMATSLMFAVSHGNFAVLPGLFLLSLSLTLALERFGSLWVSIGMHCGFNSVSLVLIYLQSQGWMPQ